MSYRPDGYNDMLGAIDSVPVGAAAWSVRQIGATGFLINWLDAGQNHYFQHLTQIDHTRYPGQALADLHLHYVLSTVPVAGNTILLDYAYTWAPIGQPIPLLAAWSSGTHTIPLAGTEVVNTHYVRELFLNLAAPANDTYSSMFFFKCTRHSQGVGADTYAGNLGLLHLDAHIPVTRLGSAYHDGDTP